MSPDAVQTGVYIPLYYIFLVIAALATTVTTIFMLWRKDRSAMEEKYEKILSDQKAESAKREDTTRKMAENRVNSCRECWERTTQKLLNILNEFNMLATRIADATEDSPLPGEKRKVGG